MARQLDAGVRGDILKAKITAHQDQIRPGDRIVIWQTGAEGGLRGAAEVASDAEYDESSDDVRVAIRLTAAVERPIPREAAKKRPGLKDFKPVHGLRGTVFAVENEIAAEIDALFADHGQEPPFGTAIQARMTNEQLRVHHDAPAVEDLLGRDPLAEALAKRLNRLWAEAKSQSTGQDDSPLVIHLSAPWGGGKSSFINFLKQHLCAVPGKQDTSWQPEDTRPWIHINFNAWQHQHVEPPWWALADSIFDQALRQSGALDPAGGGFALGGGLWNKARIWFYRNWIGDFWRYGLGLLAGLAFLILFLVAIWTTGVLGDASWIKSISSFVGAGLAVFGISRAVIANMFPRSAQAAAARVQRQGDPMRSLKKHICRIVAAIDRPIIVFIDDLDRCHSKFAVSLLEGIQTLFRSSRLVFLIAGDRRWVNVCFEQVYADFEHKIHQPGKRLGTLFLEKCFQLSFELRDPGPDEIEPYWHQLINVSAAHSKAETDEARQKIRDEYQDKDERALLDELKTLDSGSTESRLRREEMTVRLADYDIAEKRDQHLLAKFRHLLEPNPRMMKRFVNFYGIAEAIALLRGLPVADEAGRGRLALWLIVEMRWPLLAQALRSNPSLIASKNDVEVAEPVKSLLARDDVKFVLTGKGLDLALDTDSVRAFAAL